MASRFGYPWSVIDDAVFMNTPEAPGKSLASLRQWYAKIPSHLQWDSSLHPQHRRAVSLLHLRFLAAIVSLTRPFLFFSSAKSTSSTTSAKRTLHEQMSNTCIKATEGAVNILRRMRDDQTLSSLVLFDCHFIGEVIDVLKMAFQKLGSTEHQVMLQFCVDTFSAMERIGWCEKIFPEVEISVQESGVLLPRTMNTTRPPELNLCTVGPTDPFTSGSEMAPFLNHPELGCKGSQLDVFETLDLEAITGLTGVFADTPLSESQFLFDDPGRIQQV
ncbi:uncharacterized protein TRUGW13939_02061 [Talaromyces rugulosus]|uniref:Uncharacterized protein n=1 Tax=Talaromyces rugulosus TaxID=121627 RepID=A0A7H8QN53_TALRU|nr:uncharacterized protein TRUGW13939_02061 [Talaromyces rugulosus]QKX54971.1 hypothetical protein TRUGW13939_02061 [Talaromyces rugulosus]